jgi:hypothetical protein
MQRVESYYDLVSSYSCLARGRVRRICEENGAELVLRPVLLGALRGLCLLRRCSGATTGSTSSKRPCSRRRIRTSTSSPILEARTRASG